MAQRDTTDVLNDDLDNDENLQWLCERFRKEAERIAGVKIPDHLRAMYKKTAVVDTSLRQSVNAAKKDPKYRASSEKFVRLVRLITKRRKLDALKAHSGSLDPDTRVVALPTDPINVSASLDDDPVAKVSIDELVTLRLTCLQQEDDPVRNQINIYSVLFDLKAPDIARVLSNIPTVAKTPSLPTIRLQIAKAQALDAEFLKSYFDMKED